MAICQNRGPIVAQDTSFRPLCWLIEFVYEAFIHCQMFDREECQVLPSSIFFQKSTLSQTCMHTHWVTHTTMQRRGVWDIPQTASCSHWMALVSQRTIWLLSGPATCVGSECFPDWLVASGFCVLFWERLALLPSLPFLAPSLFSFSSSQVVCRGCPGNLAGFPADSPPTATTATITHTPIPSGWTAELALVIPMSDIEAGN